MKNIVPLWGIFLSYILSFISIIIYWNNHHHLFQLVEQIDGKVMWANANSLFWLSLLPFVSEWMGENQFAPIPVLMYALVSFMTGLSFTILTICVTKIHHKDSIIKLTKRDIRKGKVSLVLYFLAICVAYSFPIIACGIFVIVAMIWVFPSRKIEEMEK